MMTPNWSNLRNAKKCGQVGRDGVKEQLNQSILQSSRKGKKQEDIILNRTDEVNDVQSMNL